MPLGCPHLLDDRKSINAEEKMKCPKCGSSSISSKTVEHKGKKYANDVGKAVGKHVGREVAKKVGNKVGEAIEGMTAGGGFLTSLAGKIVGGLVKEGINGMVDAFTDGGEITYSTVCVCNNCGAEFEPSSTSRSNSVSSNHTTYNSSNGGFVSLRDVPNASDRSSSSYNSNGGFVSLRDVPNVSDRGSSSYNSNGGFVSLRDVPNVSGRSSNSSSNGGFVSLRNVPNVGSSAKVYCANCGESFPARQVKNGVLECPMCCHIGTPRY